MKTISANHRSSKLFSNLNIFFVLVLSAFSSELFFCILNKPVASLIHLSLVSAETRPYSNTFSDSFEGKITIKKIKDLNNV